jgi:structure-specific endonuclease subunit SLX1
MATSWFCYCLVSEKGRTYVGATIDIDRRLRQHNGEIRGGAKATSKEPGGWKRLCHVAGFPDNHAALQFEWRWKKLSRKKCYARLDPIERRRQALAELLSLDRPTSKAQPYRDYAGGGPTVIWELEAEN